MLLFRCKNERLWGNEKFVTVQLSFSLVSLRRLLPLALFSQNYTLLEFYSKHPEIHDFFSSQDGSKQQVFINLPGVNSPMGIIVLEWMDEKQKSKEDWEDIKDKINSEITRINALISKYTP